jgi:hypothetical protein
MSGYDDPKNAMWYHLGRASMLNELAHTYFDEAGERFKQGEDEIAHYLRDLKDAMREKARGERDIARIFEKKIISS